MSDFDDITGRLRRLGQHPLDPEMARRHLRAMSEATQDQVVATATAPRSRRFRPALAGGILAGALLGGTGLAGATGKLGPLQDEFHQVSAAVGVEVPEGKEEPRPAPAPEKSAEAVQEKADQVQETAQQAEERAQQAHEAAQQAAEEARRANLVVTPDDGFVNRFYGTRRTPCRVPVGDPNGTLFQTGTHGDYVAAHPPELRAEAAKSDCGKPLGEVDLAAHLRADQAVDPPGGDPAPPGNETPGGPGPGPDGGGSPPNPAPAKPAAGGADKSPPPASGGGPPAQGGRPG